MERGAESAHSWYARNVADTIAALKTKYEYDYRFFYGVNAKKARELTPLIRSHIDVDIAQRICESIDRNEVFVFNKVRG
jgi:hypothetical protein